MRASALIGSVFAMFLVIGCGPPPGATPGPEDPDAPKEFTTTESGLQYRIARKGIGPKPEATSNVTAHYKGWIDTKEGPKVFDSSYQRREPSEFALNEVVPGWTEGLQLVGEGGMIELVIPPDLGYGQAGGGPIPPNSTLHFLVELIKVH